MKNEKESKQPIVALEEHYKHILELIGEDCNRPGLERTPQRVAQAMCELTSGYNEDPSAELINSSFKEEYQRMVIVKDIRFFQCANITYFHSMERCMWRIFPTNS